MDDDSDDRFFDDLVNQVEIALETIDIEGFDARDSIVEGLRQALESAVEMDLETSAFPEVVVLEGGRDPSEALDSEEGSERSRPELRVIERDEEAPEGLRDVRVKVIDPDRVTRRRRGNTRLSQGTILVDSSIEWQTIYRGSEPATYRIWKADGHLEVALDGEWVEAVNSGQSLDVCGGVIRVRTRAQDPVAASYLKV
jgi:hypothetical protein